VYEMRSYLVSWVQCDSVDSEIKRREITITTKLVEEFVDSRQGIHVLYGILIEISMINTKTSFPTWLRSEQNTSGPW
jgi:hypothetical protein